MKHLSLAAAVLLAGRYLGRGSAPAGLFAAVVPVCGGADEKTAEKIATLPM